MTLSEFRLLYHLACHPNQIVPREDLLNLLAVRPRSTSRTVDVFIGYLRRKVEENPHKPDLICTVTRHGYMLRLLDQQASRAANLFRRNGVLMKLLIIGGSDAGISAALRARELAPETDITVVLADEFPNYSICGLPFFLSGETPEAKQLAHRTEFEGIRLLKNHVAVRLEPKSSTVVVRDPEGRGIELTYNPLILGTGAKPVTPPISGFQTPGVYPLHTMEHSFSIRRHLEEKHPRSAVVVGAGYIGVEMADALTVRGLDVTLIGKNKAVLPTLDADLGALMKRNSDATA